MKEKREVAVVTLVGRLLHARCYGLHITAVTVHANSCPYG